MSWVHLEDEVRALRFLMENPGARGAFNISAQPVTNRQFATALGKAMRRPAFIPVPAFVLRLLFGEMSSVILDGQRVILRAAIDATDFILTFQASTRRFEIYWLAGESLLC